MHESDGCWGKTSKQKFKFLFEDNLEREIERFEEADEEEKGQERKEKKEVETKGTLSKNFEEEEQAF